MNLNIKDLSNADIFKSFGVHEKDTGSTQVQIALLTNRILSMSEHSKKHKKDHTVKRRLQMLVEYRRTLQKYLGRENKEALIELNKKLGLRN